MTQAMSGQPRIIDCPIPGLKDVASYQNLWIDRQKNVTDERGMLIPDGILVSSEWSEKLSKDLSFVSRLEDAIRRIRKLAEGEALEEDGFKLEAFSLEGGVSEIYKLHYEGSVYAIKATKEDLGNRQAVGYHYEMKAMQDLAHQIGGDLAKEGAILPEIYFATLNLQCRKFYEGRELSGLGKSGDEERAFKERESRVGRLVCDAHKALQSKKSDLWSEVIIDRDEFIHHHLRWDGIIEMSDNTWVIADPIATIFLKKS